MPILYFGKDPEKCPAKEHVTDLQQRVVFLAGIKQKQKKNRICLTLSQYRKRAVL